MNVFDVLREKLEERRTLHSELSRSDKLTDEEKLIQTRFDGCFCKAIEIIDQVEQEYNNGWIPADEPPKDDNPVLLSFANFSVPLVGRYEEDESGGAYYVGDEDVPLVKQDMFVNGWQPLPEQYKEDAVPRKQTNADRIRSMTDEQLAEILVYYSQGVWCTNVTNGRYWSYEETAIKSIVEFLQSEVEEE